MMQLKEDYDTAIMMITHDLGVIAEIAKRIVVMYAGKVVEEGLTDAIFEDPKHPYTRGLLKSIPKLGERAKHGRQRLQEISGIVPSLYDLPEGCRFYPRCPHAMGICNRSVPELIKVGDSHRVRCYLY
jgi:peptide/nickel transport system ATP-binding protein/oligopeptide transport system ATP-binding protein